VLDSHIIPRFGEYYLDAIEPVDVKTWVAQLARKYEGNTVRNIFAVLREIFLDAATDLDLERNPCARVELPSPNRWTEDNPNLLDDPKQLAVLLEGFNEHEPEWYPIAATLAWTGLRWGEATALEWNDLDEKKGIIHVRRAQWNGAVGKPKGKGGRTVPLIPELAEIIREHRRTLIEKQHPGLRTSNLVFPSKVGTYYKTGILRKPLRNVLSKKNLPKITVHGLRRTLNNFIRKDAPGIVTRSIMGHVSEVMTNHYSIVNADEKKAAVAAVVQLVRSSGPSGGPRADRAEEENEKAE
jgi:integrase